MNRADALLFLKPRFDPLMLGVERTVDDAMTGYAPSLDAGFTRYIAVNGLDTTVMDTLVSAEDEAGFSTLIIAYTYDLLLPFYALVPDLSVDAPLTNVKFSQTYRALRELRDQAWADAADFGYFQTVNADGFVLTLTHNEPSGVSGREFG